MLLEPASRRAHRIPTPGIPRVLASLARAPFAGAKGAEASAASRRATPLDSCLRRNDGVDRRNDGAALVPLSCG